MSEAFLGIGGRLGSTGRGPSVGGTGPQPLSNATPTVSKLKEACVARLPLLVCLLAEDLGLNAMTSEPLSCVVELLIED